MKDSNCVIHSTVLCAKQPAQPAHYTEVGEGTSAARSEGTLILQALLQVFLTAYLELVMLGGLAKGQNVLIHAGASGVG